MSILNDLLRVYWGSSLHQAPLLLSYIIVLIIALKPSLPKYLLSKIITNEKILTKAIIWSPVLVSVVFAAIKVLFYSITFGPTGAGTDVYVQMRSAHLFMDGISPYSEASHFVYPPLYFVMILIPILIYDSPVSVYAVYAIFFPLSVYLFVKLANKIFNNKEYVLASALVLIFLPIFWKGVDCNFNGFVAVGMLLSILLSLDAVEKLKIANYRSARNTLVAASFIVGVITSIRFPVILPFFAMIIIFREIPWKLKLNAFITCGLTIGIIHIAYYLIFGWEMFYYTYFRVTEDVLGLSLIGVFQRSGIDAMILVKILPFLLILLPLLYCYQKKTHWLPVLIIIACGFYLSSPYVTEKYFSWFTPLIALFIWKLDSKRKRLMMVAICCLLSATIAAYSLPVPIDRVVGNVTAVVNILSIITAVLLVIISAAVWIEKNSNYCVKNSDNALIPVK